MTIEKSDGENQTVIGYVTLSPVQALINELFEWTSQMRGPKFRN